MAKWMQPWCWKFSWSLEIFSVDVNVLLPGEHVGEIVDDEEVLDDKTAEKFEELFINFAHRINENKDNATYQNKECI